MRERNEDKLESISSVDGRFELHKRVDAALWASGDKGLVSVALHKHFRHQRKVEQ